MSPALLSLLFNGTLALLLVVTIAYCSRLNAKIRQLQDGRSELAEMISRFDKSTERATGSLAELQNVSKKITEALQIKIDKANFLADDLAFLIEKSSKLATQLEQLQKQRAELGRPTSPQPAQPRPVFEATTPAAQHHPAKTGLEQLAKNISPQSGPSVASIEAMLQKLSAPLQGRHSPATEQEPSARTNAERELLNALKSGR